MIAANPKIAAMIVETPIGIRGSTWRIVSAVARRSRALVVVDEWREFVNGIDGIRVEEVGSE